MRYKCLSPHAFSAYDLYETFNKKCLKIRRDICTKKYGVNKKQKICAQVLIYCLYLILCDIIENNITFVLPLFNNRHASIYVKPVVGENFKRARQNGAFADLDFLATNFTGYQLTYSWETTGGNIRYKPIYINKRFKDVLYGYINQGKQYY